MSEDKAVYRDDSALIAWKQGQGAHCAGWGWRTCTARSRVVGVKTVTAWNRFGKSVDADPESEER